MNDNYDDIINLPRPKSMRQPMPLINRAAQFAPFAALNGHSDAINETARLTDSQLELDDTRSEQLNRAFAYLLQHLSDEPMVTITYFRPDTQKAGGNYEVVTGTVKKFDEYNQCLVMHSGATIPLPSISDMRIRE
jgi:hypothetical protein